MQIKCTVAGSLRVQQPGRYDSGNGNAAENADIVEKSAQNLRLLVNVAWEIAIKADNRIQSDHFCGCAIAADQPIAHVCRQTTALP